MRSRVPWLLAALIVLGIGFRIQTLHDQWTANDPDRTATASDEALMPEDARLFGQLQAAGLIRPSGQAPLIEVAASDEALFRKARRAEDPDKYPFDPAKTARIEALVVELYGSVAGRAVRQEVRRWNDAHRLVAVRDNRPAAQSAPENRWQASDVARTGRHGISSGKLLPTFYGYVIGEKLKPGFGDWLVVQSLKNPIAFETRVTLDQPATVEVQVIGKVLSTRPKATVRYRCPPGEKDCRSASAPGAACVFKLPEGTHTLKVTAGPVSNQEPVVPGLAIRQAAPKTAQGEKLPPQFVWHRETRRGPPVRNAFTIAAAQGALLYDSDQGISDFAEKANLVPLIGTGPRTPSSLAGILARSPLGPGRTEVRLTIEGRTQAVVQEVLSQKLAEFWTKDLKKDPHADERRAAVVIVDADSGEILAAAGHPILPAGVHPWDLTAYARVYPLKNPLVVRAWQGLDRHNAPGSTFKTVVALAGLQAAEEDERIEAYLKGYGREELKKADHESGLCLGCAVYSPETGRSYRQRQVPKDVAGVIPNFSVRLKQGSPRVPQPLWVSFSKKPDESCGKTWWEKLGSLGSPKLGLEWAVRDSLNIWFANLAILMDGQAAAQFDAQMADWKRGNPRPTRPESLQLTQTAASLGFGGDPLDLARNLPGKIRLTRIAYRAGYREGDALHAQSGRLDLMSSRAQNMRWTLAQTGIGQGMTTTPLQMARVAATVATGKNVEPYLFRDWNGEEIPSPKFTSLEVDRGHLNRLRRGMKLVPLKGGTAAKAFRGHRDRCQVFGKTGSAEVGSKKGRGKKEPFNSTWFIGWREPGEKGERRLAFACMVTHSSGSHRTGGSTCAPIMAAILEKL